MKLETTTNISYGNNGKVGGALDNGVARAAGSGIYSPWMNLAGVSSWAYIETIQLFRFSAYLFRAYVFSNIMLAGLLLFQIADPLAMVRALGRLVNRRVISERLKRIVDIAGASVGLLLTAPIFVIVPILIKLDSPGPALFRQQRVGQNRRNGNRRRVNAELTSERRNGDRRKQNYHGKPFYIFKFRTMRQDAEKYSGPIWASKNDPRITSLGRFLRTSRLDEIPQLINVLRGDMSLVGPRPERPFFIEKLRSQIDSYDQRMHVKPGITGLAQVKAGYDQDIDDVRKKLGFDLEYIRRRGVVQDLKIMMKTVVVMIAGKGM